MQARQRVIMPPLCRGSPPRNGGKMMFSARLSLLLSLCFNEQVKGGGMLIAIANNLEPRVESICKNTARLPSLYSATGCLVAILLDCHV